MDKTTEIAKEVAPTLKEVATQLLHYVDASASFVTEQAPLLAQEIINYGIASYATGAILGLLMAIGLGVFAKKCWDGDPSGDSDAHAFGFCMSVALSGISIVISIINFCMLIKPLFAPRLYLIEQLLQMAK